MDAKAPPGTVQFLKRKKTSARKRKEAVLLKTRLRSELDPNDWDRFGLASDPNLCDIDAIAKNDHVVRIACTALSTREFRKSIENAHKPAVITHLLDTWAEKEAWTFKNLAQYYGDTKIKVGEDDDGYPVRISFKEYRRYLQQQNDDSPIYLFDSKCLNPRFVCERKPDSRSKLANLAYPIPDFFKEDLFRLVGDKTRPPYRWLVLGPQRSGTGLHTDPLATSAWNVLISGYKRWALFPPQTPRSLIDYKPEALNKKTGGFVKADREASSWFAFVYPRLTVKPIEILQRPGECIFVPSNYYHVVMNLTDTVAYTQNFASSANFRKVWCKTFKGRPKLSEKWRRVIEKCRKDVYTELVSIDPVGDDSFPDSSSSSSTSSSSSSAVSDFDMDDEEIQKAMQQAQKDKKRFGSMRSKKKEKECL